MFGSDNSTATVPRRTKFTETNISDWPLPKEVRKRLRKLARLAVQTGSYLLLSGGRYRSLRGSETLPILIELFPVWTEFLMEVESHYIQPNPDADALITSFHLGTVEWMDFCGAEMDRRCGQVVEKLSNG